MFKMVWHTFYSGLFAQIGIGVASTESSVLPRLFRGGFTMVLIVEDDPLARRALKSLFMANGFPAVAVNSAEDALNILDGGDSAGVALIDIDLPGMNGIQLLGRLRETHPKLACTLMSANDYDFSDTPGKARVPFMAKPLDLKRLLGFLRSAPMAGMAQASHS
jgi:DNA-binding NtrC family response regulator